MASYKSCKFPYYDLAMIGLESYMVQSMIGLESYMVQSMIDLFLYGREIREHIGTYILTCFREKSAVPKTKLSKWRNKHPTKKHRIWFKKQKNVQNLQLIFSQTDN